MSTYSDILSQIEYDRATMGSSMSMSLTPRTLYDRRRPGADTADYLNCFNTLVKNNILKIVKKDPLSDWSTVYMYNDNKVTDMEVLTMAGRTKVIPTWESKTTVEVPAKTVEQTAKGNILSLINDITNLLGKLYSSVETMETPANRDLSKVSKDDLIEELTRRLS